MKALLLALLLPALPAHAENEEALRLTIRRGDAETVFVVESAVNKAYLKATKGPRAGAVRALAADDLAYLREKIKGLREGREEGCPRSYLRLEARGGEFGEKEALACLEGRSAEARELSRLAELLAAFL